MMQTWYEARIKYMKVTEAGYEKMVTEDFLLDAVSFTDAETRIIKQGQQLVRGGEFTVKNIKQSQIAEVYPYDEGEYWFKAKVNLVAVDEEAGKEKKLTTYYLVMADDLKEALTRINESLNYLIIPFDLEALSRTNICDVFPYDLEEGAANMSAQTEETQEA